MTDFLVVKNRAVSTLASGINDSVTSLDVAAGEGAKFPLTYPFHITIDDEILSCTNRSTDTLTVVRGQQGTTPAGHSAGAEISLNITAKSITDLNTAVNALEAAGAIPSGLIAMWHGLIANIPGGYIICDGNNGTPNLLARFVQGVATAATDPGATGGEATHTLIEAEIPSHDHSADRLGGTVGIYQPGAVSIRDALAFGEDGAHENEPPFYDVAFLMKT